jgi:hypothetical protein
MWIMVSLVSVCLELVLVSVQCMICAECTIGLEIILYALNGTPRWRGSCGILFLSIQRWCYCQSKIGAQFAPNESWDQNSFWTHPMVLLGDEAQVEAHFGLFGDSANLDAR